MIKAIIKDDIQMFGIGVYFQDKSDNGEVIIGVPEPNAFKQVYRSASDFTAITDLEPMRMSEDMARALMDALIKHFEYSEDSRMLRKDYEAERARVDLLIDRFFVR